MVYKLDQLLQFHLWDLAPLKVVQLKDQEYLHHSTFILKYYPFYEH
uniref:Uncharacterized protein n=1 Tax=CrAss-like virus sp. ctYsL76 TaxID=2826826 RepID=A0A8S5QLV7_9CAUD|nr:MAG TPA: hypothetical protein [CrAss-like virus sp. ctYsL76]